MNEDEKVYQLTVRGAIVVALGGISKSEDANRVAATLIEILRKNNWAITVQSGRLTWSEMKELKHDTQN